MADAAGASGPFTVTPPGEDAGMERPQVQLVLIPEPRDWRLDEATKAIGREGLAAARASMRAARRQDEAA
jgi:hypothetical protein